MNKHKKLLAAKLLEEASDEFANHRCNDYSLPNTDENWKLICAMEDWNRTNEDDRDERPPKNEDIQTSDFFLMSYLAHCLENE